VLATPLFVMMTERHGHRNAAEACSTGYPRQGSGPDAGPVTLLDCPSRALLEGQRDWSDIDTALESEFRTAEDGLDLDLNRVAVHEHRVAPDVLDRGQAKHLPARDVELGIVSGADERGSVEHSLR
jgi:hypothetical protein